MFHIIKNGSFLMNKKGRNDKIGKKILLCRIAIRETSDGSYFATICATSSFRLIDKNQWISWMLLEARSKGGAHCRKIESLEQEYFTGP
jgi:hypothetical protein